MPFFFSLLLLLPVSGHAYVPGPELVASPALLVNYAAWSRDSDAFDHGSETRAYLDLVKILYDRDSARPWGDEYFPEANRRLSGFRATVCKTLPLVQGCLVPASLSTDDDLKMLEKMLLDPGSLSALGARWGQVLCSWSLPLREPEFSLLGGPAAAPFETRLELWNMQPEAVSWQVIREPLLGDADGYVAGFNDQEAPAYFALQGAKQVMLNDWQVRDHAMEFAYRWKHAIFANKSWAPVNPVADDKEIEFQRMFDEQTADFARVYAGQQVKVSAVPEVLARFQKERASGDYPEETYQEMAYGQLRELALLQGSYLALAAEQRKGTGAPQQVLESLLTLQRYSANPRAFALELTTLMEPLSSHAAVLDEMADFSVSQTYLAEMMKALLGMESYADKPLFPGLGRGMLAPVLFEDSFLSEDAPDVKQLLGGRHFSALPADEQLRILRVYLVQADGKVRTMGLFRLSAAWLSAAGVDELHALAERVHEVRKDNFK